MQSPIDILAALMLAGMLGMLGQGTRALAGFKKMNDSLSLGAATEDDVFIAARLIVSLMIGFLAGVAAGLALGLNRLLSIDAGGIDVLLGIAAAGYAGTDFIETFAPGITARMVPGSAAVVSAPRPARLASAAPAAQNPAPSAMQRVVEGTVFGSLVPNGYFSADPYNENVPRSIRANNPGALNYTDWQKSRPGFAGTTAPDNSPKANVTTIYRTPEHGVAAWYHLLAARYDFPGGTFSLNELAVRYAGSSNAQTVAAYIRGWTHWLNPAIPPSKPISLADDKVMLQLAKAMFSHEAGILTPLGEDQISFAIGHERDGTLPP